MAALTGNGDTETVVMVVAYKTTLINIAVEVAKTKATMIHQMAIDIEDMEKEVAAIDFITELQITHNDEDIRETDILDNEMMTGNGKEIKKNIVIGRYLFITVIGCPKAVTKVADSIAKRLDTLQKPLRSTLTKGQGTRKYAKQKNNYSHNFENLYSQKLLTSLLDSLVIGIHLLGIMTGKPVVKLDIAIDEGYSLLTANLNGWFALLSTIKPTLRPTTIAGTVEKDRSTTVDIETLHVNLKGGKGVYKAAVSGLLINFFFCASPHVET